MKIVNIDPSRRSIFIDDIGLHRNKGVRGRKTNQARYIQSALDINGDVDETKAVQLIETGPVMLSFARGKISRLIGQGLIQITSMGEDVEITIATAKSSPSATQIFYNDYVFGRPVHLVGLKVLPDVPPAPGNKLNFLFSKNNVVQTTISDPTALTAALAGAGAGLVTPGLHLYKVTFVTAQGETAAGTASASVGVFSAPGSALTAALAGTPAAGDVDDGTHSYKVTFVHAGGETAGSAASNIVTVVDKATNGQVELTAIPVGPTGVTARKIYRTVAGNAGNYKLVATIANNTATIFTDNVADGSLGADAPSTAEDSKVALSAIPTGTTGVVTARKIYRTAAGGSSYLLLTTIADNTTTTYEDNIADGSLGAAAPSVNTTGTQFQYSSSDTGEKTIDVSGMMYVTTISNLFDENDLLDLALGLSSDTTGISSIKVTLVFEPVD